MPPEIALSHVPEGTARFKVKLVDLDFKPFNHGGGTAPNTGDGTISEGDYETFTYKGPCPPG
ncbi:MAG: phospholipid-binding protein, partial [Alphaproteobacteria bacterium]|nr:phospholipid-binding protein [Alphaproteobacteria bacterium]